MSITQEIEGKKKIMMEFKKVVHQIALDDRYRSLPAKYTCIPPEITIILCSWLGQTGFV